MIEYLPKFLAASLSGALPCVPVLVESDVPKAQRQALELMLPEGIDIIELPAFTTARVRRLWCAPTLAYFAVSEIYNERYKWDYSALPPMRFAPIIREMARRADRATAPSTGVDRVFLARARSLGHKMVNSVAIEAAAAARGFLVVDPEQLDFTEQARLLCHARFVVVQNGSGIYLTYFARPGTKLCILSYTDVMHIQSDMSGILGAIGLDITVITGPCVRPNLDFPWAADFEIDEEAFCRFLDRWLEPVTPGFAPPLPIKSASGGDDAGR